MQIEVPASLSRAWMIDLLLTLDLLRQAKDGPVPTNGGYLLFAKSPTRRIPGAFCELRLYDDPAIKLEGNLWSQLESLDRTFGDVNRPFRLKGAISEIVFPYPPLALKELLVNALVHRCYDNPDPLRIDVERNFIRIMKSRRARRSGFSTGQYQITRTDRARNSRHKGLSESGHRGSVLCCRRHGQRRLGFA